MADVALLFSSYRALECRYKMSKFEVRELGIAVYTVLIELDVR